MSAQIADVRDKIVVVDYHKGNISSVVRGLADHGIGVISSDDPELIAAARAVVLPGVGAFGDAMSFMRESGQDEAVIDAIDQGVPFLGICLGLHLLLERGNELGAHASAGDSDTAATDATPATSGDTAATDATPACDKPVSPDADWEEGLGILMGSATRLESTRLKIPHVGWDSIDLTEHGRRDPLLAGVPEGSTFYFTHSYAAADDLEWKVVAARTHYARSFPSVVWQGNVHALQFHPEKSSRAGSVILRNFVRICDAG
ncbi:MAG: imidazole glycerol phosphate synthase subunit HisH [Atopobiaceae bacterium]|nr:imidazole glycerol phosphate synthase subunit HisH [Atopobiaceae bacterium]